MDCHSSPSAPDLKSILSTLSQKIDDLNSKVDRLNDLPDNVVSIRDDVKAIHDKFELLEPRIEQLEQRVTVIESRVETKLANVDSLEGTLKEINDRKLRKYNVIIYGIRESTQMKVELKKQHYKQEVINLITKDKKKKCLARNGLPLRELSEDDELLAWWNHIPKGDKIKAYFDASSLHALKYFSEVGRPLIERYYWMITLLAVYVCAIFVVYDQVKLYHNTPVLMSLDNHATPVWDIPFPAITICSENQIRPSFFNYYDYKGRSNLTKREKEIFTYLRYSCRFNLTEEENEFEFFSAEILESIHNNIWNHCNSTYNLVTWLSQPIHNPCDILQPVLTPVGACHTFNGLPREHMFRSPIYSSLNDHNHHINSSDKEAVWTPDGGYRSRKPSNTPPYRTFGNGLGMEASFLLNLSTQDFDNNCFFGGRGFLVILHSPAELPNLSHQSTYVPTDVESTIKVTPEIKITEKQLRYWDPVQRGCFFEDERPLKYFDFYTESNCDLECESNASLSLCGCVPFFLPRMTDTPVCGPKKMQCYIHRISNSLDLDIDTNNECNCKTSCFEVGYSLNVAHFSRNFSLATRKGYFHDSSKFIPEDNLALFSVRYQKQKVIAMERTAVFGLSDFIANIGGLLGLFLGFSFLSLFEIIYFCTLRFRDKKSLKIGPLNLPHDNFVI